MILDDQFGDLRELKIDQVNSEELTVAASKWETELEKYERRFNIGCFFLVVLFPGITFLLRYFGAEVLVLPIVTISIFYKVLNAKRGNNLKIHGYFRYEIALDKVVRYSNSGYDIFKYDDIIEVKERSFGLILIKQKTVFDYLKLSAYRHHRNTQLIIPNQIYGYEQVKHYIYARIK